MEVSCGAGGSNLVRSGFVLSGASSQFTRNYNMNPNACCNLKNDTTLNVTAVNLAPNEYVGGGTPPEEPNSLSGLRWHDGRSLFLNAFRFCRPIHHVVLLTGRIFVHIRWFRLEVIIPVVRMLSVLMVHADLFPKQLIGELLVFVPKTQD
jgi:hypothetical protein